jgi:large subunit ribosomal protein L18
MLTRTSKNTNRRHVHERIRKKIQLIDDLQGNTVVFAHSAEGKKGERRTGGNVASAKEVGKLIAERAKAKGISKVVFDRGGYIYHGRVKALADAAREAGLQF